MDLIHEDQRQQYRGRVGVLNPGGIDSAIARARNRLEDTSADLLECAACYLFGLAKNHAYQDANKRTAFATGLTFLLLNRVRIEAAPADAVRLMLEVATDVADEAEIAQWLRERATAV